MDLLVCYSKITVYQLISCFFCSEFLAKAVYSCLYSCSLQSISENLGGTGRDLRDCFLS
jgi:hypothetical protein